MGTSELLGMTFSYRKIPTKKKIYIIKLRKCILDKGSVFNFSVSILKPQPMVSIFRWKFFKILNFLEVQSCQYLFHLEVFKNYSHFFNQTCHFRHKFQSNSFVFLKFSPFNLICKMFMNFSDKTMKIRRSIYF